MPFAINCSNKGCRKMQEPYLDPKTDKVFCSLCNDEIFNVNYFTKVQMKSLKQFRQKTTNSFSVKCNKCGSEERPKILKNNSDEKIVCGTCSKPLDNLSVAFKNMLKEQLKSAGKDIY